MSLRALCIVVHILPKAIVYLSMAWLNATLQETRGCNLQTSVEPLWVGFLWKGLCWKPRELQKCGPNNMLGKPKKSRNSCLRSLLVSRQNWGIHFISLAKPNHHISFNYTTIISQHVGFLNCGTSEFEGLSFPVVGVDHCQERENCTI